MAIKQRKSRGIFSLWILGILIIVAIATAVNYVTGLVSPLQPRRLTTAQQHIIAENGHAAGRQYAVSFVTEADCTDCSQYESDLEKALIAGGWKILSHGKVFGVANRPPHGIAVVARGQKDESEALKRALKDANILFDVYEAQSDPTPTLSIRKFQ